MIYDAGEDWILSKLARDKRLQPNFSYPTHIIGRFEENVGLFLHNWPSLFFFFIFIVKSNVFCQRVLRTEYAPITGANN